jgi:hypothetical protein
MLVERGIVRVGCEIEVAAFKNGVVYADVAAELIDAGYMEGVAGNWQEWHQYNCACELGCGRVKRGDLLIPPIVSMQYDGSLPTAGAEFIVSPVLLINGMEEMRNIWEIVTKNAEWRNDLKAMRGTKKASPSIHLHVSATMPGEGGAMDPEAYQRIAIDPRADVLHALSLFGPELLLLSDIEEFRRGLAFRQPWRKADGKDNHHGFVHVKKIIPERLTYIEWRMFEAAYDNWEYLETAAYLSAGLTRALLRPEAYEQLMAEGYRNKVSALAIETVITQNDTAAALRLVAPARLAALQTLIEEELDDDDYGRGLVHERFVEVFDRV